VTRWSLFLSLGALALITYVDRAAISSAKDHIARDLQVGDQTMGLVFSVFALGYAIAQAPAGWLADRFGPRWLLAGAVAVWSALTAFTGLATGVVALLIIRFSFGVAEAAAFPGSARAIYDALPSGEHGRAHGVVFAASRLGAALAFPVMAWLLWSGWRTAFFALALPGLLWAVLWALWYRGRSHDHATSRKAGDGDRGSRFDTVWILVMLQYFAVNFTTFLTLSWMNPYLKRRYDLTDMEAAGWTVVPLLVGALAQSVAGWFTDRLFKSPYRAWCRSVPAMIGFAVSTVGLLGLSGAATVEMAVVLFAIAAFGAEMTISPSWAFCLDYGRQRSGVMSGTMNTAGNIGSFVSANAFPALAGANGVGAAYFGLVAVLNGVAIGCWLLMTRLAARSAARAAAAADVPLTASE
jgi:ACS family glucarate transporter-like MFS transporter